MQHNDEALIEYLAKNAHESWSGWMRYLFSKLIRDGYNGAAIIPENLVERWKRQSTTAYADLPEEEKASDREEARKILQAIDSYIRML